jgi:hypothetical protein
MPILKVQITRFADEHFPGFVECVFQDAEGKPQVFVEKVPIVTHDDLRATSLYPCEGAVQCERVAAWTYIAERKLVQIDTDLPWHIESISGQTCFVVLASQVVG